MEINFMQCGLMRIELIKCVYINCLLKGNIFNTKSNEFISKEKNNQRM